MPAASAERVYRVSTPLSDYSVVVERGGIARLGGMVSPEGKAPGKVFVVTTQDVWELHGGRVREALGSLAFETLFFAGGEENKRLAHVERLAEEMADRGADRSSMVMAFGGGHRNRPGRLPRGHLHARHSGDPDSDHAAGTGGCGGGRQDRRESGRPAKI